MKKPDEDHEHLYDMLEDLLDRYPAAVIIVRDREGNAIVTHGGDRDALGDSCGNILHEVPAIVRAYQTSSKAPN